YTSASVSSCLTWTSKRAPFKFFTRTFIPLPFFDRYLIPLLSAKKKTADDSADERKSKEKSSADSFTED
ncbi:hypothetical protein ACQXW1_16770, partial [Lactiplantibacillus pentosus]